MDKEEKLNRQIGTAYGIGWVFGCSLMFSIFMFVPPSDEYSWRTFVFVMAIWLVWFSGRWLAGYLAKRLNQ